MKPRLKSLSSRTILDVQQFTDDCAVSIGAGEKCDFSILSYLPADPYPLAQISGEKVILRVDPARSGVIKRGSRIERLESLRANSAIPASGELVFGKDDFVRINVTGGSPGSQVSLFISRTSAPPRIRRKLGLARDPLPAPGAFRK